MKELTSLDLNKSLFNLIILIKHEMDKNFPFKDFARISPLQILILKTIHENKDLTLKKLSIITNKDKSQITRLVNNFVNMQIVEKKRNSLDQRSVIISIDKTHKRMITNIFDYERKLYKRMLKGISIKDQQNLVKTLCRMRCNIET